MGAIQAYHWASLFPEVVERAVVVCGSARTAPHNKVFLSGLLRILEAAPEHLGGDLPGALAAIRARVLLMPSETDLYFRVAHNAAELPHLASAELLPIPGVWATPGQPGRTAG